MTVAPKRRSLTPESRALIVRSLGAALAGAWRREQGRDASRATHDHDRDEALGRHEQLERDGEVATRARGDDRK